ncbi:synaptonemal complex central element protein 2 isoform X2 [Ambystoma mexicanum]
MSEAGFGSKTEEQESGSGLNFSSIERSGINFTDGDSRNEPSPTPSMVTSHGDSSMAVMDSKSANYFAVLDSSIEGLQNRAQHLIDKINENRKKDQTLLNNFRESLTMKVSDLMQKLEEKMYEIYDHNNKLLQDKLQELPEILERITQLETELKQSNVCMSQLLQCYKVEGQIFMQASTKPIKI